MSYERSAPGGGMKSPLASPYIREKPRLGLESSAPVLAEGTVEGFGTWVVDGDGLLTISGKGRMPDATCFERSRSTDAEIRIRNSIQRIRITGDVTSIGSFAFWDCGRVTEIVLPDSVTSIGDSAFNRCRSLTRILLPNAVTSIGRSAFEGCSSLKTITIPAGVVIVDMFAFCECGNLTSVTIADGVNVIDMGAFSGCYGLRSITIPDSVTELGRRVFHGCIKLWKVRMPSRFNDKPEGIRATLFGYERFKEYYGIPKYIVTFT